MWLSTESWTFDERPIDPSLFDTLATLPSLHTVKLIVKDGELDIDYFINYIASHTTLRSLSIHLETTRRWTREQQVRVEEAAEAAGVAFSYFDRDP
ncbi:hypothetical protein RQP46_010789 [Phenoliferia psychrophenolica]